MSIFTQRRREESNGGIIGSLYLVCGLILAVSEVFKQFSQWFDWYINTPIYIFAVCLGAYLIFTLIYWIRNKKLPIRGRQKAISVK